jgi:hypothetical protein
MRCQTPHACQHGDGCEQRPGREIPDDDHAVVPAGDQKGADGLNPNAHTGADA